MIAAVAPKTNVLDIPVSKIHVPEERKKKYNYKKDERLQQFLDSIVKEGVLHPIIVRPAGDDYEVVAGRKRFWAVKSLGYETIPATVRDIPDHEIPLIARFENYCRGHLNAAEQALELKELFKLYEQIYGSDPGRAIGGVARAASAKRDPNTKSFGVGVAENPVNNGTEPATDTMSVAGSSNESEPNSEPQTESFSSRLARETGQDERNARRKLAIDKAFNEKQLRVMSLHDVSQADLLRIAALKNPELIDAAVREIAIAGDVEAGLHMAEEKRKELESPKKKEPTEDELPEKVWLEEWCGQIREKLQDPSAFDRDALFYRRNRAERHVFRAKTRDQLLKGREAGYSPLIRQTLLVLYVDHPRDWLLCAGCMGRNKEHFNCQDCYGCGYRIRMAELPKRK